MTPQARSELDGVGGGPRANVTTHDTQLASNTHFMRIPTYTPQDPNTSFQGSNSQIPTPPYPANLDSHTCPRREEKMRREDRRRGEKMRREAKERISEYEERRRAEKTRREDEERTRGEKSRREDEERRRGRKTRRKDKERRRGEKTRREDKQRRR